MTTTSGREPAHLPQAYRAFLEHFNNGLFWESHEVLEGAWRVNRSPFFRGLIIYASAFVHAQRGNPRGVVNQLTKALRYLEPYPPTYLGLDVEAVRAYARSCLVRLAHWAGDPGAGARACLPPPSLQLHPAWVRGDEPELGSPHPHPPC